MVPGTRKGMNGKSRIEGRAMQPISVPRRSTQRRERYEATKAYNRYAKGAKDEPTKIAP
jgi:hypothetical protein